MDAQTKSYFLAPNWDYQVHGPLALGNLLYDPSDPVFSKLTGFPSAFDSSSIVVPPKIYANPPDSWAYVDSEIRAGRMGLFMRFLQNNGLGVEGGITHSSEKARRYDMESIQTSYFVPDTEYIVKRLRDLPVRNWLKSRSLFDSKSVYLITGVKVARGLIRNAGSAEARAIEGNVTLDGNVANVPLKIGAYGERISENASLVSGKNSRDIVFAYQLRKIKKKGEGARNHAFNKGAFLSNDKLLAEDEELECFEIDDHDATADDVDGEPLMEMSNIVDVIDGEQCNLVIF